MTVPQLVAWLDGRQPRPPEPLRAHLAAAVSDALGLSLPEHLARLGQQTLRRVTGDPDGGRALALDLLAADAFVTYAFEAQAETDVGGLALLAERVGGVTA
jgi:hypothetical protein